MSAPRNAQPLSMTQRLRLDIRAGRITGPAHGQAPGYAVCNLVMVRQALAADFQLYCARNARACPLLEVTEPGSYEPRQLAPGADLRTDLSRFAIYHHGEREADRPNVLDLWGSDLVAFLIGSGISFDAALEQVGVPTTNNRWVVRTKIETVPAGRFHGPLVATMRWLTPEQASIAARVTAQFPLFHGAPIHTGDPAQIGADLDAPLLGPPVPPIPPGLVPVFWACGVTPQQAALVARIDLMITHAPGHAFITDQKAERYRSLDRQVPDLPKRQAIPRC